VPFNSVDLLIARPSAGCSVVSPDVDHCGSAPGRSGQLRGSVLARTIACLARTIACYRSGSEVIKHGPEATR
jgi:hypothetical protein